MKAAPFEYVRPQSIEAALAALAADDEARIVAGGQTLVPMMAMRLARPSVLVDIAHIPGLAGIEERDGDIRIGAMTRQIELERSTLVAQKLPLLAAAMPWIGHYATRARGTVGGSVANADPAAEIPLVLTALGGVIHWQGMSGAGQTPARAFFTGPMMTALDGQAILTAVSAPVWQDKNNPAGARIGASLHEVSQRRSDFAYVSAAAQVQLDAQGVCQRASVAIGGACPAPVWLQNASEHLTGKVITQAMLEDCLAQDIEALEIMSDGHASPAYRRRNALTLAQRALLEAVAKAEAVSP